MKTLFAILLAGMTTASFADSSTTNDTAAYRSAVSKNSSDYTAATANCTSMARHAKDVCINEAKVARMRANADAVASYNNGERNMLKARTQIAEAEYGLAKARCGDKTGTDKSSCMTSARAQRVAMLDDARAGREIAANGIMPDNQTGTSAAGATTSDSGSVANSSSTGDNGTASTAATNTMPGATSQSGANAAMDKCAQVTGQQPKAGCMIDNKQATTNSGYNNNANNTANTTGGTMTDKADKAMDKTGAAIADSVITTKVKADMLKERDLKSTAVHVETVNGVVMLSGFVGSQAEADKAVDVAKNVKGVSDVKSTLSVK